MKQVEKKIFYEYFLSKINQLENEYILLNNNMSKKGYRNCDPVDFLELMIIKNKLNYTIQNYYELKTLLHLK